MDKLVEYTGLTNAKRHLSCFQCRTSCMRRRPHDQCVPQNDETCVPFRARLPTVPSYTDASRKCNCSVHVDQDFGNTAWVHALQADLGQSDKELTIARWKISAIRRTREVQCMRNAKQIGINVHYGWEVVRNIPRFIMCKTFQDNLVNYFNEDIIGTPFIVHGGQIGVVRSLQLSTAEEGCSCANGTLFLTFFGSFNAYLQRPNWKWNVSEQEKELSGRPYYLR